MELVIDDYIDPTTINVKSVGSFINGDTGVTWVPGEHPISIYQRNLYAVSMYVGVFYNVSVLDAHTPLATIQWKSINCPGFHPLEYVRCTGYSTDLPVTIFTKIENIQPIESIVFITIPVVNLKLAELIRNYPIKIMINDQGNPELQVFDVLGIKIEKIIPLRWRNQ